MADDRIEAIPTEYNGVWYKSRLEARFARWALSQCGDAQVFYEPHRIGSNQYLPDFLFAASDDDKVYVEVKPIAFADDVWLAINAARETGDSLIVVDALARDAWYCYASVSGGELDLFTTIPDVAHEVGFRDNGRPSFYYGRTFYRAGRAR